MIPAILIVGLAIAGSVRSDCVDAQSCENVFNTYTNANWEYSAAFQSYYYNNPTTCQQDCEGQPDQPTCLANCQITRQTDLAAADTALFAAAWATCTPATVEQCAQAHAMAANCAMEYNYQAYPDQDESLAIYAQYSACILASKVDACQ